jgi:hypothetical protein
MNYKSFRAFALLPCAALILGAAGLQASTVKSEKFEIPFAFQVQKHAMLPAGEYQIQQAEGSEIAFLVNTKTGQRVVFVRPATNGQSEKTRLIFETVENEHLLKQIS